MHIFVNMTPNTNSHLHVNPFINSWNVTSQRSKDLQNQSSFSYCDLFLCTAKNYFRKQLAKSKFSITTAPPPNHFKALTASPTRSTYAPKLLSSISALITETLMKPCQVDSKLLLDRGLRSWWRLVATSVKSMLRFASSSKLEAPRSEHFAWAKKKKAHLMKHALGMHFWCFLKKHKAGLGALFYFTAKKDMNHQN